MRILSIDPGINTGWCLWHNKQIAKLGIVIEPKINSKLEYADRICGMVNALENSITGFSEPNLIVMEGTAFWETSHKSRVSARSGSLQFLSMLVGAYIHYFFNAGMQTRLINPIQWKGQMPDSLVVKRANSIIPNRIPVIEEKNIHICCAIGIGAHYLGFKEFNHENKSKTKK